MTKPAACVWCLDVDSKRLPVRAERNLGSATCDVAVCRRSSCLNFFFLIHEQIFILRMLEPTLICKGRGTILVYMHANARHQTNVRFDPCACTADSIQWALAGCQSPSSGFIVDRALPRRTWGGAIAEPAGGGLAAWMGNVCTPRGSPSVALRALQRPSLGSRPPGFKLLFCHDSLDAVFFAFFLAQLTLKPPKDSSLLAAVEPFGIYKSLFVGSSSFTRQRRQLAANQAPPPLHSQTGEHISKTLAHDRARARYNLAKRLGGRTRLTRNNPQTRRSPSDELPIQRGDDTPHPTRLSLPLTVPS